VVSNARLVADRRSFGPGCTRTLERFFRAGDVTGIQQKQARRLRFILTALSTARTPRDMGLPGLQLHPLRDDRRLKGFWAVSVSENYRVIFRFDGTDVVDVDYVDYH
jgi:proteic killer suppression protein